MLRFTEFLAESTEDTEKLKHLEHAEDHPINAGATGFKHAVKTLIGTHNALQGKKSQVRLTTKYDGAPSIVFGTHPETGKFFVASKSAFNKNPKINYTKADIEKNHGHAPGLVTKLSHALEHLPKVTPHGRVFQGDMMYSDGDVEHKDGKVHFKPNTIKYSAPANSPTGKKAAKAKVGVAVHTEYHGKDAASMKASFGPDVSAFGKHDDVHIIDTHTKVDPAEYTPKMKTEFKSAIKKAMELHKGHDYSHMEGHKEHVTTYINDTVRQGTSPSAEGLIKHVKTRYEAKKSKLKSEAGKSKVDAQSNETVKHIKSNKEAFNRTFEIHKQLQNAKHAQVKALSSAGGDFEHHIGDKKTGPEGHVALLGNKPTKLVDRSAGGFAASNMVSGGIKDIKKAK